MSGELPIEKDAALEPSSETVLKTAEDSSMAPEPVKVEDEFPITSVLQDAVVSDRADELKQPPEDVNAQVDRMVNWGRGLYGGKLKDGEELKAEAVGQKLQDFVGRESSREEGFVELLHEKAQKEGLAPDQDEMKAVLDQFNTELDDYVEELLEGKEVNAELLKEYGFADEDLKDAHELKPEDIKALIAGTIRFEDFSRRLIQKMKGETEPQSSELELQKTIQIKDELGKRYEKALIDAFSSQDTSERAKVLQGILGESYTTEAQEKLEELYEQAGPRALQNFVYEIINNNPLTKEIVEDVNGYDDFVRKMNELREKGSESQGGQAFSKVASISEKYLEDSVPDLVNAVFDIQSRYGGGKFSGDLYQDAEKKDSNLETETLKYLAKVLENEEIKGYFYDSLTTYIEGGSVVESGKSSDEKGKILTHSFDEIKKEPQKLQLFKASLARSLEESLSKIGLSESIKPEGLNVTGDVQRYLLLRLTETKNVVQ